MPGFDYLIKWTCWDTVWARSPRLGYPVLHHVSSLSQSRNTRPSSPANPNTNPALSDETGKFKYKPNFVGSLGSVVLQLNKDSATSLLAFIINSSFLNGVFKMVLSHLKKDWRRLSPSLFRIPPLKLLNKAKCQHQLSALTTSVLQPVSCASLVPDIHAGEPYVGASCSREQAMISSHCEENLCFHIPASLKVTSASVTCQSKEEGKPGVRYAWNFKLFSIQKK